MTPKERRGRVRRTMASPRILSRQSTVLSPWVTMTEKSVELEPGSPPEVFHCITQADYVTIVARLPDGRIPLVRQFRVAVEVETWEFPAGMMDPGETPETTARRELLEETGASALRAWDLGTYLPDTGRMENSIHVIGIDALAPSPDFIAERGIAVELVTPAELRSLILSGHFRHQLHLGALAVASLRGFDLGVFAARFTSGNDRR